MYHSKMSISKPHYDGTWRWDLEKQLGHEGETSMVGLMSALQKGARDGWGELECSICGS